MLWDTNTGTFPLFAVQVGFSQASDNLETKVKDLVQKTTVRVALMIDIKEKPMYKNPFRKQKNIDLYRSERNSQPAGFETLLHRSCEGCPLFSPVFMYGLQWTGEFSASVQVFAKDLTTGKPVNKTERISFFGPPKPQKEERRRKEGERSEQKLIYEESPNLNTKLSDFVPLSDEIYKQDLILKWNVLRRHLGLARKQLARERYLAAIEKLEKDGMRVSP
ncbi:hypothetical protein PRK78_002408 [Emydomyces testavorans]|uniref:Uncharacterized protein n=1 Tax=Emydomyces testavorans TaxID=2070801 RepID=A0AAF0DE90_9EURO|nr:hypothetical protein PRK78_002408 [Emydomyces testavorans]